MVRCRGSLLGACIFWDASNLTGIAAISSENTTDESSLLDIAHRCCCSHRLHVLLFSL
jgi:hypothetical protein